MSKRKEIRLKEVSIESLALLREISGIQNDSRLIELALIHLAIIGKQHPGDVRTILASSYNYYSLGLSSIDSINIARVDISNLGSYNYTSSKKYESESDIPKKKEESYQQSIFLHEKVKGVMPYGSHFESWWIRWRGHLRDSFNFHPTKETEQAQLKILSDLNDEQRAIETIKQSITNGWKGLFPDKLRGKKGTTFSRDKAKDAFNKRFGTDTEEST